MYCPNCGSDKQSETKFCTRCGTNLAAVTDLLAGKSIATTEIDRHMVALFKDYYRGRRALIVGGGLSVLSLVKLGIILLMGFPEKLLPAAALLLLGLLCGLVALVWGLIKWNDSTSEIKAIKQARELSLSSRDLIGQGLERELSTNPIAAPTSVTEQTTRTLKEPVYAPPAHPRRSE
jgi:hypothetical protein